MEAITKLVFQPEALAVLLIVVSVVVIFTVYTRYAKEAPALTVKLNRSQTALDKFRERVAETKKNVAALQQDVKLLKELEPKMMEYSDAIRLILQKKLEEEAAEEEKKAIKEHKHSL